MSITDELRQVAAKTEEANGRCGKLYRGDLDRIADRIDAEHEAACAEAYGNGVMSVPIALDESQWVKLPADADGVPIRVGDVLTDGKYTFTAYELAVFGDGSWSIRNEDGSAWYACDVTHHHTPTVEDVLREMLDAWGELPLNATDEAIIAEYAAKLRLAGEDE